MQNRLLWCLEHQHWTEEQWLSGVFIDEGYSEFEHHKCGIWVKKRRQVMKRLHGPVIMIGRGISVRGKTPLCMGTSSINSERYR